MMADLDLSSFSDGATTIAAGPKATVSSGSPDADSVPRLVVIDACNVSRSSSGPKRETVDCAGLLNVFRWLVVRNFERPVYFPVNAFLPIIYKNKHNVNVAHAFILNQLHTLGIVSFTPARAAHSERPALVNYDDLYLGIMASRHGGCILSGDRFADIIANPEYKDVHGVLRNRINMRFFPLPSEFVEIGIDRLYKKEPAFIVEHGGEAEALRRLYARPGDPGYEKAVERRRAFTPVVRDRLVLALDDLLDEMAERDAVRPVILQAPTPASPPPPPPPLDPSSAPLIEPIGWLPPEHEQPQEDVPEPVIVSDTLTSWVTSSSSARTASSSFAPIPSSPSTALPIPDYGDYSECDHETLVAIWLSPPL